MGKCRNHFIIIYLSDFFVICGIFYQCFNIFCMWFRFCFVIVCGIFCMRYCLNRNSEPRQFLVARVWSRGAGCLGWKSMCANEDINLQPHGATKGGQGLVRVECKDESRHRVIKWLFLLLPCMIGNMVRLYSIVQQYLLLFLCYTMYNVQGMFSLFSCVNVPENSSTAFFGFFTQSKILFSVSTQWSVLAHHRHRNR